MKKILFFKSELGGVGGVNFDIVGVSFFFKGGDEFVWVVVNIVVLQVCEGLGFYVIQWMVVEILVDIVLWYFSDIGKVVYFYVNFVGWM